MTAVDTATGHIETVPEAGPSVRRRSFPRWETWSAAVPVVILVTAGWQRRWMADDGLIHLRVVENVLGGHGFVFNAGERVEASTSALWVALLALLRAPGLVGLESTAVVTGLAGSAGGLFLAIRGAELLWRGAGRRHPLLPAGAVVLAVLPPMWDFATSGLETGLVFFWLGATFFLLSRLATAAAVPGSRLPMVAAVVSSAGPLIRPDLALFTGAFLVATVWVARRRGHCPGRRPAALVALGLALPAGYQLFRMGYYGALVPTTALAKEAERAWWTQGWVYLTDFLRPYWLAVPLVVAAALLAAGVAGWIRDRATDRVVVAAAPVRAGLADVLYVCRVGGDFMHGRMLLPGLFAVLMPVAVIEARSAWRAAAAVSILPWAVVCAAHLRVPYVVGPHGITDERSFWSISAGHRNPVQVGAYRRSILYTDGQTALSLHRGTDRRLGWRPGIVPVYASMPLRPDLPFRTAFVAPNLGITGVLAGPSIHIVDPSGLADAFASRLQLSARGRPGHEKALGRWWVVARFGDPGAALPEDVSPAAVTAARRALGCGPLRDLQAATTDRLTVARFVRNIGVSIRLRNLRLPSDPGAAESRFCR